MDTNMERPLAKKSKNNKLVKCKLKALRCYRSSERGGDEIYLKLDGKQMWPQVPYERIHSMGEVEINLSIVTGKSAGSIRIELWEKDILKDDFLGYFLFVPNGSEGEYVSDLRLANKNDTHRYAMVWEI